MLDTEDVLFRTRKKRRPLHHKTSSNGHSKPSNGCLGRVQRFRMFLSGFLDMVYPCLSLYFLIPSKSLSARSCSYNVIFKPTCSSFYFLVPSKSLSARSCLSFLFLHVINVVILFSIFSSQSDASEVMEADQLPRTEELWRYYISFS